MVFYSPELDQIIVVYWGGTKVDPVLSKMSTDFQWYSEPLLTMEIIGSVSLYLIGDL